MFKMILEEIWVYPIKSCGGVKLHHATVNPKGLDMDRRYMLIDQNGNMLSQRQYEAMSQIHLRRYGIMDFLISYKGKNSLILPCNPVLVGQTQVKVWDDVFPASLMDEEFGHWFSSILGIECRLVFMEENTYRPTREFDVGMADGYHSLIISQEAVKELNHRLDGITVSSKNFRPNFVFSGAKEAHVEDEWVGRDLKIGGAIFSGRKVCSRCKIITIDPDTSQVNSQIMSTLGSYRLKNEPERGVYFGLNLSTKDVGKIIHLGDKIHVI